MSITITITIPGPVRLGPPGSGPAAGRATTWPVGVGRAEQVWLTVRPYLPVLLAGAESLVPGLGIVVALAGVLQIRAHAEQREHRDTEHGDAVAA